MRPISTDFWRNKFDQTFFRGDLTGRLLRHRSSNDSSQRHHLSLAPIYLSTQDNVNTISTSATKRYSKCAKVRSHKLMEYLIITITKNESTVTETINLAGLDYVKFKLHHFKRSTKTKVERNPLIYVKPKFIFCTGQHPTQSQYESSRKPHITMKKKEHNIAKLSSCQPAPDPCCNQKQDISSRGRSRKLNHQINVNFIKAKNY